MSDAQFIRRNIDGLLIDVSQPTNEERDTKPIAKLYDPEEYEERDTTTIAGKFANALDCLENAAGYLRDIVEQYNERYPDDECEEPELFFWQEVRETIDAGCFRKTPLQRIQEKLEAVTEYVPKEVVELAVEKEG